MFYEIKCLQTGQNESASLPEELECTTNVTFTDIKTKKDIEYAKKVLDNLELD